jgi:predicted TIM-barrel fold metal-dependent hydrolase
MRRLSMLEDAEDFGTEDPTGWSSVRGAVTLLPEPDPSPPFCPIISVDDHYLEPRDLFTARVPGRLRDEVPRMEDDNEGVPWWVFDDRRVPIRVGDAAAGRPVSEWSSAPQTFDDMRPGVWNVDARIHDMDLNGTWASLNFPSITWGFAGTALARLRNPEAGLAAVRAYNDWVIDEWTAAYPDRFIACQMPWLADPVIAAEEIRRNAARDFKAVSFSENPESLGYPGIYSRHWDPFLAACAETGTVVNLHTGSSGAVTRPSSRSPVEVQNALFPLSGIITTVDWIFAKIPLRFPDLRIVVSEGGVSWVPMVIERLGRAYRFKDASVTWGASDGHPVDCLRHSFWFTSIEDPSAFQQLDLIGRDRVMVESDYPHLDGSWPETQDLIRKATHHLDADTIREVCYKNAATLYRHAPPPRDWLARSVVGST